MSQLAMAGVLSHHHQQQQQQPQQLLLSPTPDAGSVVVVQSSPTPPPPSALSAAVPSQQPPPDQRLERLQLRLSRLEKGALPEYQRGLAALEAECRERQQAARDWYSLRCQQIGEDHDAEKAEAHRELRARRQELMDLLLAELAERRRAVEAERASFDLNFDGDVHDVKQPAAWRLRTRPKLQHQQHHHHHQAGTGAAAASVDASASGGLQLLDASAEAAAAAVDAAAAAAAAANGAVAGAPSVASSTTAVASAPAAAAAATASGCCLFGGVGGVAVDPLLAEADIQEDLRALAKARHRSASVSASSAQLHQQPHHQHQQQQHHQSQTEASQLQVVDGVLFYRDRSYGRGAQVTLETRRAARCCGGVVAGVTQQEVILKRSSDGGKMKVSLKHLRSGKFVLRKKQ